PAVESRNGFTVSAVPSEQTMSLAVCKTTGPFESLAIREALRYAVDPAPIAEAVYLGQAVLNGLPLSHLNELWNAELSDEYPAPDADRARELLEESGYDGETIVLGYGAVQPGAEAVATILQSQLSEVGFDVEVWGATNIVA